MVIEASEHSTTTRRQAILDAALTSFASKGFTETTMEDIRKLSGASMGSIYHHFSNKEMLARALYLDGRSSLQASLSQPLQATSLREGIEGMVYGYLDWFEQHADLGQYIMQAGDSEYLGAYVTVLRQKTKTSLPAENLTDRLFEWLTPYINEGKVVNLPRSLYLPLLVGPGREFIRIWLRTRPAGEIQVARQPLAKAAWLVLANPASSS